MSTSAVVMMIVAMVMVWGGLVLALVNIKRSPEEADELDSPAPGEQPGTRGTETVPAEEPAAPGRPA